MLFQPNEVTLDRFIKEKLSPMIESTGVLESAISRTRSGNLSLRSIPYRGGSIFMGYSGSVASFRSVSALLVIADEIDAYQMHVVDATNPVNMLRQRGRAYGRSAKLVIASTPKDADITIIDKEYYEGTAKVFRVPCPHCGVFHLLVWENIYEKSLVCPECNVVISEEERLRITEAGYWEQTNENPADGHESFHLNQLYSPFVTIVETVNQRREDDLRVFSSQVLAIPFDAKVEGGDASEYVEEIYKNIEKKPISDLEAVTVGVDIQGNRIEYQVVHWYGFLEPHIVLHKSIERKLEMEEVWKQLNQELRSVKPDMIFIDRGWRADEVRLNSEKYLRYFVLRNKLKLVKGVSPKFYEGGGDLLARRTSPRDRPLYLNLYVDEGKLIVTELIIDGKLKANPRGVPENFTRQLTAEKLKRVVVGTSERQRWVKEYTRNEGLDCMVYNLCARDFLGETYHRSRIISSKDVANMVTEVHAGLELSLIHI